MCGIIGAISENNAVKTVFNGLKRLDYRGYDSWGISVKEKNEITVFKKTGKIPEKMPFEFNSNVAVGHTRWATHGGVTDENAHPHLSNNKKISVVHNGIIENFEELKESLEAQKYEFKSETDTEVIPNLVQFYMDYEKKDFITAIIKTLEKIDGNYAVIFSHSDFDGLIAARNGSPLVCGIGSNEFFFASDVPAFLEHTNKVVYLNDLEMAIASEKGIHFFDLKKNKKIEKKPIELDWSIESAEKGNYPYFMIKEINEQPETLKLALIQPKEKINSIKKLIKNSKNVFFIGCGTSFHACITASYFFSEIAGIQPIVVLASEFEKYKNSLTEKSIVLALTQSGETADLIDAIKIAKEKNAKMISIVNVMGSTITTLSDEFLLMNAGPEICVLSTKSYTSQLTILLLLAFELINEEKKAKKLINELSKDLPELIKESEKKAIKIAEKFYQKKSLFVIGRELAYPSALEGALKIKEVSYIHAEGFAGGELKHGPIALIEEDIPVIAILNEHTRKKTLSNVHEIKARGGTIIGIDSKENQLFDYFFKVKDYGLAYPIASIVPIQLLAYHLALKKGCNVDKPRNLAKCVTVR
ncbi:MAG: glutamine--fructose-6-phosphate transaminase (isomerizing) [Candidatus Diapherotrites archaeon]